MRPYRKSIQIWTVYLAFQAVCVGVEVSVALARLSICVVSTGLESLEKLGILKVGQEVCKKSENFTNISKN